MSKVEVIVISAVFVVVATIFVLGIRAVETPLERQAREWDEECSDETQLVATTSGSPNSFRCPNKRHRMRVQVKSTASNEEAAAFVFCECSRKEDP